MSIFVRPSVPPSARHINQLGALKCHCRGRQWIFKRQCLAGSHIDECLVAFADLFISLKNEKGEITCPMQSFLYYKYIYKYFCLFVECGREITGTGTVWGLKNGQ